MKLKAPLASWAPSIIGKGRIWESDNDSARGTSVGTAWLLCSFDAIASSKRLSRQAKGEVSFPSGPGHLGGLSMRHERQARWVTACAFSASDNR